MQKITKQNLINSFIIVLIAAVYVVFYDRMYAFCDIIILSVLALCLLTRGVIFKSESSTFISLSSVNVCVIMLLDRLGIISVSKFYPIVIISIGFIAIILGVIFSKRVLYKLSALFVPIGMLCELHVLKYVSLIVLIALGVAYFVGYYLFILKGKGHGKI